MKILLTLFCSLLFATPSTISYSTEKTEIHVQVSDKNDLPLIGANVTLLKYGKAINTKITDADGLALFIEEKAIYDLSVSYTGYETKIINNISAFNEVSRFQVTLKEGNLLEEVIISGYDATKEKKATSYPSVTRRASEPSVDDFSSMSYAAAPSSSGTAYRASESSLPTSGQITAGEWNDLYNWKEWIALLEEENYKTMESYWNISARNRYSILALNENDQPLSNVEVALKDNKGNILWSAKTDLSGRAELWEGALDIKNNAHIITGKYNGKSKTLRELNLVNQGSNVIRFQEACQEEVSVDIAFIVDATSSMSDEIRYLQSELLDVVNRVKNERMDLNWASVFYRDTGEEYVTKKSPFSKKADDVLAYINNQYASGGGDFPEAVSEALEAGVQELSWRLDSDIKLMFLLLDAPPHGDEASMKIFKDQVKLAAAKGIKIIPITASGINRETEFLMKFTALLTNGTYVFITDDSGIGNAHLDPVVKDYEVEKLNDLIVRLITSYSTRQACENRQVVNLASPLKYYPNPAVNLINIEGLIDGDKLHIISTSGKIVKTLEIQSDDIAAAEVDDLISGTYLLRHVRGEEINNYPVLIVK